MELSVAQQSAGRLLGELNARRGSSPAAPSRLPLRRLRCLSLSTTGMLRLAPTARSSRALQHAITRRSLSTSTTLFARPPSFTTPAEQPIEYTESDSKKPLPPTDLPVEDYASPLLHTASFFHSLFRYAVFGSVGIVSLGLGTLAAIHAWVEKVELAGGMTDPADEDGWGEELEGWSGAWRGGGTDPRLGFFARAAVRGAWISQHWGGGIVASPVSQTEQKVRSAGNPFASSLGGAMIGGGKSMEEPSLGKEVGDAGWRLAENYLVYAMTRAEAKGISLVFPEGHDRATSSTSALDSVTYSTIPDASTSRTSKVDRAAVELESRLANLRERIGGRYKLEEAREGWERIYYALSSVTSPSGWEAREKLRATKKLGEISARLAGLWRAGTEERELEESRAEGWYLGGVLPVLARADGRKLERETLGAAEKGKKVASPLSSFFGFWSHSHPTTSSLPVVTPTTLPTLPTSTPLRPEFRTLLSLLHAHSTDSPSSSTTPPLHPATTRAVLSSLIALEAHLARLGPNSLPTAHALQSAALHFTQNLLPHSTTTPTSLPKLEGTGTSAGSALTQLHLATRTAVLSAHLAEVSLALRIPGAEPPSLALLQGSINTCESVLGALGESALAMKSRAQGWASGREKVLARAARGVRADAGKAGAMSANLVGLVHEMGVSGRQGKGKAIGWTKGSTASKGEWCGGPAVAEVFYGKAMEFARGGGGEAEGLLDASGLRIAEEGFARVKARVLSEKKA